MGDTRINDTLPEFRGIRFKLKFINLKYIGKQEKLWSCYVAIIITVTTPKWCM